MILRITKFSVVSAFAVFVWSASASAAETENPTQASASIAAPVGLRCEYLVNPLGIDVAQPRLSWRMQSIDPAARGLRQSAYQILVSDSAEGLAADRGELWDSGPVESNESVNVVYGGKPLPSRTACFWKVRVWDQDGRPSQWSEPARWSMGLLDTADWKAKWIGVAAQTPGQPKNDPWFRKTFTLTGQPKRATAYVASLGFHELYVNGHKVDDRVLAPSISDLTQRVRYVAYDLSRHLRQGKNAIVIWAAAGWADYPDFAVKDKPLVLAQIEIQGPDGQSQQVVTDATWKTHPSPMRPIGVWTNPGFGGESYDASGAVKAWNLPELDDSSWPAVGTFVPKVRLSAEMIEPTRPVEKLTPVAITSPAAGVFRVDLGRNYAGWLDVSMRGQPGQKVTFEFAERPNESVTYGQTCEFIFGDQATDAFRHRFNHSVGRWVTIRGLTEKPLDVRGELVTTDCRRTGQFECSNRLMNRIYETTVWTHRSLSACGYLVDCPHRERRGYGGDAHATMETAMTNFDTAAFYTKWLEDWRDVQRPDGDLPYTAPTYSGGGGPAWSGICVTLPWQVYLHFGDRRILEQCYPTMQRWIAFLDTKAKGNLLQPWGGIWDFLGDWVPPGKGQGPGERVDDRSTLLFNNCYYLDNVATMAKVAALLGKTDDAAAYTKRAAAIAQAAHREFFRVEDSSYACGEQLYEAMPLLVGVVPQSSRPAVLKRLEQEIDRRKGHLDSGIHGTYYLLKSLLGENRNDLVFRMANQKSYPGWGHMLEQDATTIWEQWDGQNSLLHSSFLSIGSWFIEGIAGIQLDPAQPGYRHFFVRPGVVGDLTWAKGEHDSPYGKVRTDWRLSDGWLTLSVDVPVGTSATVFVPTHDPASVTESGRPAAESPGVHAQKPTDRAAVYRIGSGHYVFRARWRQSP
jgi:alpha-L-rhamnosidase